MSSIPSDYPDWLRVDQWVGSPFLAGTQFGKAPGTQFGPFFVAPWEAISFSGLIVGGGAANLQIVFTFTDGAGNTINTVSYLAIPTQGIVDVIPVQSLFMTVQIGGYVGNHDVALTVVPRRGYNSSARLHDGAPLLTVANRAIGSGVNQTALLNDVMATPAVLAIYTTATTWLATLNQEDGAGTLVSVLGVMGTSLGQSGGVVNVELPPTPVRLSMTNSGAGAANWWASVMPSRF